MYYIAQIGKDLSPVFRQGNGTCNDIRAALCRVHNDQQEGSQDDDCKDHTNNFCDSGSYFLCLHYISTSFFLLMDTCVRDTMARMIKNTTAFVCPSAYWFLLIAVLYMFRARNSVACTGFPARIRLGAPLVIDLKIPRPP